MTNPIKALAVIGASCIIATALIYLLLVPDIPGSIDFLIPSLTVLILAELMLFGGIAIVISLKRQADSILMVAGSISLMCICSVALFATGLIFISAPMAMLGIFLSICLLVIFLYAMGFVAFFFINKRLRKIESNETQLIEANLARASKLKNAAECCTDLNLRSQLLRVSDDIRYSDAAVCISEDVAMDECIDMLCDALKAGDVAAARESADDLIRIERNRKEKTTLIKRGGM